MVLQKLQKEFHLGFLYLTTRLSRTEQLWGGEICVASNTKAASLFHCNGIYVDNVCRHGLHLAGLAYHTTVE